MYNLLRSLMAAKHQAVSVMQKGFYRAHSTLRNFIAQPVCFIPEFGSLLDQILLQVKPKAAHEKTLR